MPLIKYFLKDNTTYTDTGYTATLPTAYTASLIPILSVYVVYTFSTFIAFIYRALYLRDSGLLERSVFLLSVHTASGVVFVANVIGHGLAKNYPCFIDLWLLISGYTTWMVTFILYMGRYYVVARSNYILAKQARINPVTPDNLVEYLSNLRSTSYNVLWAGTPSTRESVLSRITRTDEHAQLPDFLANPISRPLTWLRDQLQPDSGSDHSSGLTQAQVGRNNNYKPVHRNTLRGDSGSSELSSVINTPSVSLSRSFTRSPVLTDEQQARETVLLQRRRRRARLSRWFLLNRFYVAVYAVYLVILVIYLTLMSTLFTRLKLGRIFYNCFAGAEFLPHTITTGIFNIIIGPSYMIIIWRYRDAYGIRNSLCVAFALGILVWSGVLVWRLISSWRDRHISASVLYVGQIIFVHSLFITAPLVKSIRFARAQKRGKRDTENIRETNAKNLDHQRQDGLRPVDICRTALDGMSRQSFFLAMQDTTEHDAIERFAETCFCTEMVLFLDVYLAFKECVFRCMLNREIATRKSEQQRQQNQRTNSHCPSSHIVVSSLAPSIVVTESVDTTRDVRSRMGTPSNTSSFSFSAVTRTPTTGNQHHQQSGGRSSRVPRLLGRHNLSAIFSAEKKNGVLSEELHSTIANSEQAERNKVNVHSLSIGIVETLRCAFPNSEVDDTSLVLEELRPEVCAILKSFILPNSPFELNMSAQTVDLAKRYIRGGNFPYHEIDRVKDAVIDLLYSNVYIRFRQSLQK